MTTLASAAFRLALRGIAVFPLTRGTKVPLVGSHGCHDATSDADTVRAWWARHPRANIGAATGARSGFWVLDVDAHHEGDRTLADLESKHGPLPPTIEASTPQGGLHLYWPWPANGPEIRNSAGRIGPGLDVRGEGGSIVMPPSVLADGRRYRWTRSGAGAFAEAPRWLVEAALPPPPPPKQEQKPLAADTSRYCAAAIAAELRLVEEAISGVRNERLNRASFAIGQFVGCGAVPQGWAEAELERRALAAGLAPVETRRTITSGLAAGMAHPRELPR